jgi:hypothetical protein
MAKAGLAAGKRPMFQRNRATSVSLPAPTGGWNARDSIADMPGDDAVQLINMFPMPTQCALRFGYSQFATNTGGAVETIMNYAGAASSKLFAIAHTMPTASVFNVTSGGAVGVADLSGLTNARWQYINVTTSGGNFIEMCNGADGVYTYDGTTWTDRSAAITGVTAANLIGINLFKNRVWFVEAGTLKAWYLPTQSIQGAANALDMSAYAPHGGYLMAMATWTIDAGYGVDDLAVFVTNNGDVLVWRGTDPSSASTWALVGVWWLGSPVGRRCFVKWKGDMLLITQDGVLPLSGALQSSRLNPRVALTDKIQSQMSAAVTIYGANFGWQLLPFPQQNMLILNVPVQTGDIQEQYVMNTITGAWGQFQGWNANCWELYNNEIYFGGDTYVGKAWNTNADNGVAINTSALQAFNYFGSRGQLKRFTMMRPTLFTNGTPSIQASINVDFDTSAPAASLSFLPISASTALWDAGVWDTALWGADLAIANGWQGATGVGYCGAPRFASQTTGLQLQWISTEVVLEPGGIL